MKRATKIRVVHWLINDQYGWYDRSYPKGRISKWRDRLCNQQMKWIERPGIRLLCRLTGHLSTRDHCGIPAHDFCLGCNKPMPGQAPEHVSPSTESKP